MPRTRRQVTDPALAVAYLRTSTEDQANGLSAQSDAIHAYARSKGLRIVAVHRDAGVSGAKPAAERAGFTSALTAMREHNAGVLLVAKRDRLARDVVEAAVATKLVERVGGNLRSADGVSTENTPEAALMRTLIDAFAAFERALIRARTAAALRARRDRGQRYTRFPPFGWRYDATGRMVVISAQQETLRRMQRLRSRGVTYRAIGERLLAEGRRPARARTWSIPMVRSLILRTPG